MMNARVNHTDGWGLKGRYGPRQGAAMLLRLPLMQSTPLVFDKLPRAVSVWSGICLPVDYPGSRLLDSISENRVHRSAQNDWL